MSILRPLPKAGNLNQNELDHQRLIALINSMSEAVLAIDSGGKVILSNSVALDLLNANSLTDQFIWDIFRPIDKNGRLIELQAMLSPSSPAFSSRDWKLNYNDGSYINLFISFSPVRTGFGNTSQGGFLIVFRDITREKTIEEERDEFISVASHELRTPIAVVEGSISNALLLAQRSSTTDSIKQSLAAAHDQIIFLGNLINDLSMLSRAERGKLALTVEQWDVAKLVDSLVHDYTPQATAKKLTINKQLSPDIGALVSSQLYVREILQNFVTNAIKYTEAGSITLRAEKKDGGVEFKVADTGIGIGQNEQKKLFSKFFRSDDWRVKKITGTGLGLYVSGKLAKLIGASINVNSQINAGTTFSVFVPNLKTSLNGSNPS